MASHIQVLEFIVVFLSFKLFFFAFQPTSDRILQNCI
jgi:hypothetical protein